MIASRVAAARKKLLAAGSDETGGVTTKWRKAIQADVGLVRNTETASNADRSLPKRSTDRTERLVDRAPIATPA